MKDEMQMIQIDEESFDKLKEILGEKIKDKCDFCGEKITGKNFGLLSYDYTVCNSLLCLAEYFDKIEELKSEEKK